MKVIQYSIPFIAFLLMSTLAHSEEATPTAKAVAAPQVEFVGVTTPEKTEAKEVEKKPKEKKKTEKKNTSTNSKSKKVSKIEKKTEKNADRKIASLSMPSTKPSASLVSRNQTVANVTSFTAVESTTSYAMFRVSTLAAIQANNSNLSTELAWTPEMHLTDNWTVGANLGWMMFQNQSRSSFQAVEYQVSGSYRVRHVAYETAIGMQSFMGSSNYSGTHLAMTENANFLFHHKFLGVVDRVVLGYSAYLYPGNFTNEIKLGVGLSF